jgi:hypothetical protein
MSNPTIEATVPAVRGGESRACRWWGNLAILKLTGEQTRTPSTVA